MRRLNPAGAGRSSAATDLLALSNFAKFAPFLPARKFIWNSIPNLPI